MKQGFDYKAFDTHPELSSPNLLIRLWHLFFNAKTEKKVYQTFANDNSLTYTSYEPSSPEVGGAITSGHSFNILEGELVGLPFRYVDSYVYHDTSLVKTKKRQIAYSRVSFMRFLPHLVIDTTVDDLLVGASPLSYHFEKADEIKLEGDFNRYFRVYCPDRYEISALTILAPNIMELLIREKVFCDIEIYRNHLYIYWHSLPLDKKEIERRFDLTQKLTVSIKKKLIRSDIFADTYQRDTHMASIADARPAVLKKRKRLFTGLFSMVYTTLILIYLLRDLPDNMYVFGIEMVYLKQYSDLYLWPIIGMTVIYLFWLVRTVLRSMQKEEHIEQQYPTPPDASIKEADDIMASIDDTSVRQFKEIDAISNEPFKILQDSDNATKQK